jgi:hypothetical protein
VTGGRRRTGSTEGRAALARWRADPAGMARADLATAVRFTLEQLADAAPGGVVEVRVPPYGVVQCVEGSKHTRGTPPNVVETDAGTWLALVVGDLSWAKAVASGRVQASGNRADLAAYLPLDPGTVAP